MLFNYVLNAWNSPINSYLCVKSLFVVACFITLEFIVEILKVVISFPERFPVDLCFPPTGLFCVSAFSQPAQGIQNQLVLDFIHEGK